MTWWMVSAAANAVVLLAYLLIAGSIAYGLTKTRQWRSNPLAGATAAIFLTCAVHHGSHVAHMLLPYVGLERDSGLAMRRAFEEWHLPTWDLLVAGVAVWYWTLRGRFPALVRGTALFEDLRQRQRQALEINDNIVQGLAVAKYAFAAGDEVQGHQALEATLASSRRLIGDLLGSPGSEPRRGAGQLVRDRPASVTGVR